MSELNDKLGELRKEVVKGAQTIYAKGLVENGEGNVSVRVNKNEILITPSSNRYEDLTPESIVHLDLEGNPINSNRIPSTETKMHLAVYKSRPKVKCVIHDHSSHVSMLSVLRKSIPIIMEQQIIFLGLTRWL